MTKKSWFDRLGGTAEGGRRLIVGLAVVALTGFSTTAFADQAPTISKFCTQCVDESSARAIAKTMAPSPSGDCDDDPLGSGEESRATGDHVQNCSPVYRRVYLINHLDNKVYSYEVWIEHSMRAAVAVPLTNAEQVVSDRVIELRLAWDDLMEGTIVEPGEGLVPQGEWGASDMIQNDSDCPSGTALDAVLNPHIMQDYKELIVSAAVQELPPFPQGESWISRLSGIGAQALGFGMSAQWESDGEGHTLFEYEFEVSEVQNPISPDRLVFDVEFLGETGSGAPMLDIQFNETASRAAGQQYTALESGGAVTNECALAKIEEALSQQGYTFHVPAGDPAPSPFPENTTGGGGGPSICTKTLAAKVNGVTQYLITVYVPCELP